MNTYSKIASEDYNKHHFVVKDGHIQEIRILWGRDDVIGQTANNDVNLTDDEIDEVLYCLSIKHDATIGVSWDTIDFWIGEVVSERKNK